MRSSRRAPLLRWPIAAGILVTLSACAGPDRSIAPYTGAPAFDVAGTARLSGRVLGPHGANICDSFPAGTMHVVQAAEPERRPVFVAADTLVCPDNSYAFDLAPGSYYRRFTLKGTSFLGALPHYSMDTKPVRLNGRPVTSDIRVEDGAEVRGEAYLDGAPFVAQPLEVQYAPPLLGITALTNQTGSAGTWEEANHRIPRLQRFATYEVTCPQAFGAMVTRGPVVERMHVASPVLHVDCVLTSPSPATRFTHHSSRLVLTAMPGDVGGTSNDLSERYGFGWGVQYPIGPAEAPRRGPYAVTPGVSPLYRGGLIVAVPPDRVLFGFDTHGYAAEICPDRNVQCRGLGLDAQGRIGAMADGRRVITWVYSDAFTGSRLGLVVRQRSFDALDGRDYVVFQFRFRNQHHASVTFYAGLWMDWDVSVGDVGFTDFNGHLMYVTSAGGGSYFGSVTASDAAIGGNAVYQNGHRYAPDSIYSWATGAGFHLMGPVPSDWRTLHTVGPITLDRSGHGDVWIAVVAGDDYQQLVDNAAAAQNAIAQLKAMPDLDE